MSIEVESWDLYRNPIQFSNLPIFITIIAKTTLTSSSLLDLVNLIIYALLLRSVIILSVCSEKIKEVQGKRKNNKGVLFLRNYTFNACIEAEVKYE